MRMELSKSSTVEELTQWVRYWSGLYKVLEDKEVLAIADSHPGFLTTSDLHVIFDWKLTARDYTRAAKILDGFNPAVIEEKTKAALLAKEDDVEALESLRGLPQMMGNAPCAVASCLLMVLDQNRWTVIDVRANASLMKIKEHVATMVEPENELHKFFALLLDYKPRFSFNKDGSKRYPAVTRDWPLYVAICRRLAEATGQTLRTIDRALFQSKGDLFFGDPDAGDKLIERLRSRLQSKSPKKFQPSNESHKNLHDDLVQILLGFEGRTVLLSDIQAALPHRASTGVLPGDHDPLLEGQKQICGCNTNSFHVFKGPGSQRGEWIVSDVLYWRNGERATRP